MSPLPSSQGYGYGKPSTGFWGREPRSLLSLLPLFEGEATLATVLIVVVVAMGLLLGLGIGELDHDRIGYGPVR